jgi:hypothetical protein
LPLLTPLLTAPPLDREHQVGADLLPAQRLLDGEGVDDQPDLAELPGTKEFFAQASFETLERSA